jgi:hypothetical protein
VPRTEEYVCFVSIIGLGVVFNAIAVTDGGVPVTFPGYRVNERTRGSLCQEGFNSLILYTGRFRDFRFEHCLQLTYLRRGKPSLPLMDSKRYLGLG